MAFRPPSIKKAVAVIKSWASAVRAAPLPFFLVLGSLVGSAYVLGLTSDSSIPFYSIDIFKICDRKAENFFELDPESTRPAYAHPHTLVLAIKNQKTRSVCTAVKANLSDANIRVKALTDEISPRGMYYETELGNLNTFKRPGDRGWFNGTVSDPPGHYFQHIPGAIVEELTFDWSPSKWIGFSRRGFILDIDIGTQSPDTEQDWPAYGEEMTIRLRVPEGWQLESSTQPAPQKISVENQVNVYTFVLSPTISSADPRVKLAPSLRVVYQSEIRSQIREFILFVCAAIFGFGLQYTVDGLRERSRKRTSQMKAAHAGDSHKNDN